MVWYRITLCVGVFCFLQFVPSDARPSNESATPIADATASQIKPDDLPVENLLQPNASEINAVLLDSEKEKAVTANPSFTVINAVADSIGAAMESSNNTGAAVLFTSVVEKVPEENKMTANADATITFVTANATQTVLLGSAASVSEGTLEKQNTDDAENTKTSPIANADETALQNDEINEEKSTLKSDIIDNAAPVFVNDAGVTNGEGELNADGVNKPEDQPAESFASAHTETVTTSNSDANANDVVEENKDTAEFQLTPISTK